MTKKIVIISSKMGQIKKTNVLYYYYYTDWELFEKRGVDNSSIILEARAGIMNKSLIFRMK